MSKSVRSRLAVSLCALATVSSLVATQAWAQSGPGGPGGPGRGREVCGAPTTGAAPDIMSYDSATGTQVFVNSGRGTGTDVSAYNAQTGSAAQFIGDLSRPGLVSSCSVDGFSRQAYGVDATRPGQLVVSGRDERGERWAFTRADGKVEVWDPRGDNRCFKSGLGIFTPAGGYGVALATPPGAIGVGIAAGQHFGGVGVGANRNFVGAGLVGC